MTPLLFSALLLASDPTVDPTTAATDPAEQAAPAKKEKEKKICKPDPGYTGSRMQKKICLTAAEWDRRIHSGANTSGSSGRSYTAQ